MVRKRRNFTRRRIRRSRKIMKRLRGGNKQPLKVAILFAGRVKSYENALQTLMAVKNEYNPTYYCSINQAEYDDYLKKFCETLGIPRENVIVEPTPTPNFLNHVKDYKSNDPKNAYSMFYHENNAFGMIERDVLNGTHFDCIMYTRADIDTNDHLHIEMPKDNTIYIPYIQNFGGLNDRLAYGNFNAMKKYCNLIKSISAPGKMDGMNPESILKKYVEEQKLEITRINYVTTLTNDRNEKAKRGEYDKALNK